MQRCYETIRKLRLPGWVEYLIIYLHNLPVRMHRPLHVGFFHVCEIGRGIGVERNVSSSQNSGFAKVDAVVCRVLHVITFISGACLIGIMLVAFFNVIGEKLRGIGLPVTGIPASTEIIQYLHIPVVFLAAAFVTLDRGHTRVDLLSAKLPQAVQFVIGIIADVVGIVICIVIAKLGFDQMSEFMAVHRMSSVSGVGFPLWPFALIMSIGFILLALSFVWAIVRDLVGYHPVHADPNAPAAEEPAEEGGEG